MDVSNILNELNDRQRDAVTSEAPSLLVLAGAGSGKTRVLVHRVAWIVEAMQSNPNSVMAVTFTNKAANEMKSRIQELLQSPLADLWCGTFHGLAHRTLKRFYKEANLISTFTVLDAEDQLRVIKRICKDNNLEESSWPAKQIQWQINSWKDAGKRPKNIDDSKDFYAETVKKIYSQYDEICKKDSLVDFAELLLKSYELLKSNTKVRDFFHRRFRHILIDEFQDTNVIQYAWLNEVASKEASITAVGDDDQSIYGWRGAKVGHLEDFKTKHKHNETIRLEQNYRSTSIILNAANALIENNQARLGKNLWTESNEGEQITLYQAFNEQDEARFVAEIIKSWMDGGELFSDSAVIYRSNAQSRAIEEALLRANIPYRIYGGLRFYDRLEIKNAISYLRIIFNPHDNPAFERSVANPTRGVGAKTLAKIRSLANKHNISYIQASSKMIDENIISGRGANGLKKFLEIILGLCGKIDDISLSEIVGSILEQSGLIQFHEKEPGEKGKTRKENLEELLSAAKNFEMSFSDDKTNREITEQFLSNVSLDAGDRQADEFDDAVQLMTLHSAKGLEFPLVFMTGLEETLFPHGRSMESPDQLEEERRLCYVGITRAMKKLYLTYAESRRLHGNDIFNPPSRFIKEIPPECIMEIRPKASVTVPYSRNESKPMDFEDQIGIALGQKVQHPKFGQGIVLNYEGAGESARVQVNFENAGTKWLVLSFANLEVI
ncbi:MAG: DNA helicase II [Gammaproteobacteria bacterium]|nr:DNA helicase II [Gammaproteobacteria bacterium]|tara:strand:+ start:1312 stop:3480 length:2169 start_codon:yes stop_codon:yes gene_type:complete